MFFCNRLSPTGPGLGGPLHTNLCKCLWLEEVIVISDLQPLSSPSRTLLLWEDDQSHVQSGAKGWTTGEAVMKLQGANLNFSLCFQIRFHRKLIWFNQVKIWFNQVILWFNLGFNSPTRGTGLCLTTATGSSHQAQLTQTGTSPPARCSCLLSPR